MMICLDYEKSSDFNNMVGSLCYPSSSKSRYLVKKVGANWSYKVLDSSFNTSTLGNSYRQEYGADSFFIGPPTTSDTQGVYKFMYVHDRSFYEATSLDRGDTWRQVKIETNSSDFEEGNAKKIYARSRNSNYEIAFVGLSIPSSSKLQYTKSYPSLGSAETIKSISTWGFDFKYDYKNIPTVVNVESGGGDSSKLCIKRKVNGTWTDNTILNNVNVCKDPTYYVPKNGPFAIYYRAKSKFLSIDFDSTDPDLIYIAYLINDKEIPQSGLYTSPAGINVCCYNMSTNQSVFNENVVSSTRKNTGLLKLGVYNDMPIIYYNTANKSLNLIFFASENTSNASTYYFKQTKRLGNNSWSSLTDFLPTRSTNTSPDVDAGTNYWDVITKY
jgi:hypothetical protein